MHAGDDLATVVELDPLYVKIYINENYYPHVQLNQSAEIRIQGMDPMEGKVVYIASVADDQTHTFECHIQIDNPEYAVPSGMSATIKIMGSNSQSMHKIPPVALSMDHEGCVGVKTVENSKVVFYPIQIQESNATEVWALGLPEDASIIVTGQDFVKPGEVVISIEQPSGV